MCHLTLLLCFRWALHFVCRLAPSSKTVHTLVSFTSQSSFLDLQFWPTHTPFSTAAPASEHASIAALTVGRLSALDVITTKDNFDEVAADFIMLCMLFLQIVTQLFQSDPLFSSNLPRLGHTLLGILDNAFAALLVHSSHSFPFSQIIFLLASPLHRPIFLLVLTALIRPTFLLMVLLPWPLHHNSALHTSTHFRQ